MGRLLPLLAYPFTPVAAAARDYDVPKARADLLAGLSVTVVAIPQALAFALIAGVPPVYGLYGVMVQVVVGSLLTSSSRVSIGPTNTLSLLVASVATRVTGNSGETYLTVVFGLTFLTGLMQLAFAGARLGNLVRYVSTAVIVGFTGGAGVLIAAKQIPHFLGLPSPEKESHLPGLLKVATEVGPHLSAVDAQTCLVGAVSLAAMLGTRRVSQKLPSPLAAVLVGGLGVALFRWGGVGSVARVGALPTTPIPPFALPPFSWNLAHEMLGGATALALVGMIEAIAIGKSLGSRNGEPVDANREMMAQGLVNTISSCFHCYPGTASFSRSALNEIAGARTRFSGVFCGAFVLTLVVLLGAYARLIPLASLAAILFVVAYGLVDWRYFLRIWRTDRADASVCAATFGATLLIPLEYAVFVGIFLNLALYLRRASRLHIAEMVRTTGGRFAERPMNSPDPQPERAVRFLQVEGDLFFGVADELRENLDSLGASGAKVVILRLKRTHVVDSTVLDVLEKFVRGFRQQGGQVILCGVRPGLRQILQRFGLMAEIEEENVFEADFGVFTSARRALQRAYELTGEQTDLPDIADEEEGTWFYVI